MKILILTNHSYMLWQFRRELVERLLKDHQVALSMPYTGHEEDFAQMGCKCIRSQMERRGTNPFKELELFGSYYSLLKKEKPELVITYSIKPNLYGGFLCRCMHIPYCANVQGLGTGFQSKKLSGLVTFMYKCALKRANTVFFENQGNADAFIKMNILKSDKIKLLKGAGINLSHYSLLPYPEEETRTHFLYLGRIMKEKGMDELFYAVRKLHDRYGAQVVLDMVGFYEDAYKEEVERLAEQGIVKFHGFQSETRPFYGMSHCVVLPSYHEGMSNVLLEAAACGRPVITSDIYGCREAVEEGVNGFLCKPCDGDSLFAQMDRFLQLDVSKRRQMGLEGRRKMEREFDKTSVVNETVAALGCL